MLTATREQALVLEETAGFSVIDPSHRILSIPWVTEMEPTLLLVEDDHRIALSITLRLNNEGYHVLPASNASEALRHTSDEMHLPDVILIDITLPVIDGLTLAEMLREEPITENIPVIFLTGSRDPLLRLRARGLSAQGFFEKPYEVSGLLRAIESAL